MRLTSSSAAFTVGFVVLRFGEFNQVKGVLQALADVVQTVDDTGERGALLAEFGRFFGVVPRWDGRSQSRSTSSRRSAFSG